MAAFEESWAGDGVEAILAADVAARQNEAMDLISMVANSFSGQPLAVCSHLGGSGPLNGSFVT